MLIMNPIDHQRFVKFSDNFKHVVKATSNNPAIIKYIQGIDTYFEVKLVEL